MLLYDVFTLKFKIGRKSKSAHIEQNFQIFYLQ